MKVINRSYVGRVRLTKQRADATMEAWHFVDGASLAEDDVPRSEGWRGRLWGDGVKPAALIGKTISVRFPRGERSSVLITEERSENEVAFTGIDEWPVEDSAEAG